MSETHIHNNNFSKTLYECARQNIPVFGTSPVDEGIDTILSNLLIRVKRLEDLQQVPTNTK